MKKIFIGIIKLYQCIPGTFHYKCRHIPTCSNYGIEAIEKHGCIKGGLLTMKRILKCNPFFKAGYDPVPERKKKMKKFLTILCIGILSISITGCFKRDNLEDITIYTTTYPIEYITNYLYGEHSTIYSIYPDSTDITRYSLTNKQIKDYSSMDMYIFSGLTNEKDYVNQLFKHNKNLMIIDASQSMEYTYNADELWLDPSNFLMLSLNIKNGLAEYIENHYLKEKIEQNYENLKVEISNIDAKLNLMSESADNTTLVVDNNLFKFLEKYGFTVISLDENTVTDKNISDVTNMIYTKQISYIFTANSDNLSDTVKNIKQNSNVEIIQLHTLSNLTEEERSAKQDYISIMNDNINLLKNELYNN